MVGAQHVDDALSDAAPDARSMLGAAHGRVHLKPRAEASVIVGGKRQVMRRRLAGGDVLGAGQKVDFLHRRNMQHMHLRAHLARDADEALRAEQRRRLVAPDMVRGRVAGNSQGLALVEPRFVLGMERRATAGAAQNLAHACIVRHQQRARGRTHEHLDARRTRQPLQFGDVGDIVMGPADPERVIAGHPPLGPRQLVGESLGRRRLGVGVGHFEHGGDAAQHGGAGARCEILLVLQPRLAKMHLAVDHAGQDVQAPAVDALPRRLPQRADLRDAPVAHADVAHALAVVVHHRRAGENALEALRHVSLPLWVSGLSLAPVA